MRIFCKVAAEFTAPNGETIFKVTPDKRLMIMDAPEAIKDTLMFKLLLNDGSIDVIDTKEAQKKAENEPTKGMTPDGKKDTEEQAEEPVKPKTTRKTKAKSVEDDAQ